MAEETKIIRIVVDSSKAVDGSAAATRALERLEKAQGDAVSSMDRVERALDRVGGFVKANLALLAADMAARFIQMGKTAFDAASGLDELAEQLGITAKGLQGLQFSAVQNGIKLEQLETGVSKFSQKMGEAAGGSKEMITALNGLGVRILDVNGKLRPTEVLLQDVAASIAAIDDPARRAAAAVDFFGKAGTKMLPMLNDMSGGMDEMAAKAKAAGAFIEAETVAKLDKLGDSAAKAGLATRALFAESSAGPLTGVLDVLEKQLGKISGYVRAIKADWTNVFTADSNAEAKLSLTIADRENKIREAEARVAKDPGRAADFRLIDQWRGEISRARAEQVKNDAATGRNVGVVDWVPRTGELPPPGASNPVPTGTGDDVTERMRKALQDSQRGLDEAAAFAAAANQGADAVAKLEIHFKALKTAQDIFGKAANDNKEGVERLTAKLEEQAVATQKLKAVGDFRLATEALRDQNELLAAEIRLTNELPEIRARELALIKLTQEEKAKGQKFSDEDREARLAALATGERLKVQAEEIKRSTELWMEPLKTALSSIQTTAADAFEGMLNSGKYNFEELGQVFKKMVIRMAAEFMALATVRPVMSVLVNAVSPGMASTFGLGGGTSMPSLGGGGGMSMPSMPSVGRYGEALEGGSGGGLSGMFGGVSSFLSQPLGSLFPSAAPAGGFADVGALLSSGSTGASASASGISGIGGVSIGSALGAGLGIGMGAYQAITSKSTGGTLGGIGTMIGSGMMLIPGMQIPGMIVTALSAILPMLMPEADTRTHNSTNASLRYGAGGYGTSGGAWGPGANVSQSQAALGSVGNNIGAVYDMFGGVQDASKVWGMDLSSWTASGKDWSYTSRATHLVDPSGNRSSWRMNEDNMVDTASAQVAMRSILSGAVGTITENMRTAVTAMLPATTTLQDVAKGVDFVTNTYEQLGKAVVSIKPGLDALEKQFREMTTTASSLGLSLEPVAAEQKKRTERLAQDFIDGMLDPLAVQLRALEDQQKDSLASAEYIRDNVEGVYVDIARITDYWNTKRLDLETQYQQQSVGNLQALVRRLTYGDLAAASLPTTLAGTRGTYEATLAQARAGGTVARDSLATAAEAYGTSVRQNFASSAEGAALIDQIRRDLLEVIGSATGGAASTTGGSNDNAQTNALAQQFSELMGAFRSSQDSNQRLQDQVAALTAQLQRRA